MAVLRFAKERSHNKPAIRKDVARRLLNDRDEQIEKLKLHVVQLVDTANRWGAKAVEAEHERDEVRGERNGWILISMIQVVLNVAALFFI